MRILALLLLLPSLLLAQPYTVTFTSDSPITAEQISCGTLLTSDSPIIQEAAPQPEPPPPDPPPPEPTPALAYRINCGGPDYTAANGDLWSADAFFTGGTPYATTAAISGTGDQVPYQTNRYQQSTPLVYSLPLADGSYTVRLHFAEIATSERIMGVRLEGVAVLSNFHPYVECGWRTACTREFTVSVSGGALEVEFDAVAKPPAINGLEVFGSQTTQPPAPPADVRLAWDATVTNEDGSPIDDLAGYRVYHEGVKIADLLLVTEYLLGTTPLPGAYWVTAIDAAGNESTASNSVAIQ